MVGGRSGKFEDEWERGGSGGWLGNGMRGVVGGRARGGRGGEEELVGVGLGGMVW